MISPRVRMVSQWGFIFFFFEFLGHHLVVSFNEAYEANQLTISQRRGIITRTPKEDDSLLDSSNWRPTTLLNVDCKIATKVKAKRLEVSLPKLINHDQTGFIKGRYIGENIRFIIVPWNIPKRIPSRVFWHPWTSGKHLIP